jgi:hypothetical protein
MSREYSANVEPLYGDVISYPFAKASEAYIAFSNMRPEFDEGGLWVSVLKPPNGMSCGELRSLAAEEPEYYMEEEEVMIRTDWEKVLRDSTSVVAKYQWQSVWEHGEVTWSGCGRKFDKEFLREAGEELLGEWKEKVEAEKAYKGGAIRDLVRRLDGLEKVERSRLIEVQKQKPGLFSGKRAKSAWLEKCTLIEEKLAHIEKRRGRVLRMQEETSAIAADKIEEMAIHKISRVHPALTKARITVMREMQRENLKAVELTHNVGLSRSRIDNSMTHER